MKIAINTLGPSSLKTGIGNYVVNLVNWLARLDTINEYCILSNESNSAFFDVKNKNFHTIVLPKYTKIKILRIFWEQLRLPFLLKKMNIDLLHSPGFVAPLIKTTKSVVTIHDMTFFSHQEKHTKSKVWYFKNMIPLSAKRADAIIADSDNTKKEISKYLEIPRSKITTVYLGVSKEFKQINKKNARAILRKKYSIENKFILFVGMIEPRKNLLKLVDAFLHIKVPLLKLVIVGQKGWHTKELFETIKELNLENEVLFPGYVPDGDLVLFYNAAEVFVYPSLYEGFGIPVLEAMACGCPVVTSNVSSLPEIAENAALLVNPLNVNELAKSVHKILKDSTIRDALINRGLRRAKEFTWDKTAHKTLDVYYQVFGEK